MQPSSGMWAFVTLAACILLSELGARREDRHANLDQRACSGAFPDVLDSYCSLLVMRKTISALRVMGKCHASLLLSMLRLSLRPT